MNSLIGNLRRAYRLLGPDRRWRWVLLATSSLSLSLIEAVGAGLIYLLVSLIASPEATVTLPLIGDLAEALPGRSSRELRTGAALAVAAFFVLRALYLLGLNYLENRIVWNARAVLASDMLDGYLDMPYLFHTQRSSAELMRNTLIGVQKVLSGVLIPALTLLTKLLLSATLIATLVYLSPSAMVASAALLGTTLLIIQKAIRPRLERLAQRSEEASKNTIEAIQQALGGIRDIKLLRREMAFSGYHRREQLVLARNTYVGDFLTALSPLAIETALMLSVVTVFVLATVGTAGTTGALPILAVFAYVGLRLQPILQDVVGYYNKVIRNLPMLDIIEEDRALIDQWRSAVAKETDADAQDAAAGGFHEELRFSDVSFSYSEDQPPVLSDVDLVIRRGEFIGICGPTGGGKSTLIDLMIGLLRPTSGSVSVDGVPLGRRPAHWWDILGVVSQTVFLTDGTLRENIAFGAPDDQLDEDRLQRCIERAQLGPVVQRLPDGLDTIVGERGVRLSGGQRQRVAIARALYREPEVLILDEGTSALDGATERALVAAIDQVAHDRTLVAIAHRIATIRGADRIIVVADGRIQDVGTHDELLARNELFRALA